MADETRAGMHSPPTTAKLSKVLTSLSWRRSASTSPRLPPIAPGSPAAAQPPRSPRESTPNSPADSAPHSYFPSPPSAHSVHFSDHDHEHDHERSSTAPRKGRMAKPSASSSSTSSTFSSPSFAFSSPSPSCASAFSSAGARTTQSSLASYGTSSAMSGSSGSIKPPIRTVRFSDSAYPAGSTSTATAAAAAPSPMRPMQPRRGPLPPANMQQHHQANDAPPVPPLPPLDSIVDRPARLVATTSRQAQHERQQQQERRHSTLLPYDRAESDQDENGTGAAAQQVKHNSKTAAATPPRRRESVVRHSGPATAVAARRASRHRSMPSISSISSSSSSSSSSSAASAREAPATRRTHLTTATRVLSNKARIPSMHFDADESFSMDAMLAQVEAQLAAASHDETALVETAQIKKRSFDGAGAEKRRSRLVSLGQVAAAAAAARQQQQQQVNKKEQRRLSRSASEPVVAQDDQSSQGRDGGMPRSTTLPRASLPRRTSSRRPPPINVQAASRASLVHLYSPDEGRFPSPVEFPSPTSPQTLARAPTLAAIAEQVVISQNDDATDLVPPSPPLCGAFTSPTHSPTPSPTREAFNVATPTRAQHAPPLNGGLFVELPSTGSSPLDGGSNPPASPALSSASAATARPPTPEVTQDGLPEFNISPPTPEIDNADGFSPALSTGSPASMASSSSSSPESPMSATRCDDVTSVKILKPKRSVRLSTRPTQRRKPRPAHLRTDIPAPVRFDSSNEDDDKTPTRSATMPPPPMVIVSPPPSPAVESVVAPPPPPPPPAQTPRAAPPPPSPAMSEPARKKAQWYSPPPPQPTALTPPLPTCSAFRVAANNEVPSSPAASSRTSSRRSSFCSSVPASPASPTASELSSFGEDYDDPLKRMLDDLSNQQRVHVVERSAPEQRQELTAVALARHTAEEKRRSRRLTNSHVVQLVEAEATVEPVIPQIITSSATLDDLTDLTDMNAARPAQHLETPSRRISIVSSDEESVVDPLGPLVDDFPVPSAMENFAQSPRSPVIKVVQPRTEEEILPRSISVDSLSSFDTFDSSAESEVSANAGVVLMCHKVDCGYGNVGTAL